MTSFEKSCDDGDKQVSQIHNEPERLQKAMARLGIASRRHAEELISQGKVKVNGQTVTEPGVKVNSTDVIEVEGKHLAVSEHEKRVYILLHKPEGVVTSVTDPRGRKTVIDLLKREVQNRVYPVGRLDYDTSGLLLLTNDGELTYRLTHPRYGVEKTYRAWIKDDISPLAVKALQEGVPLDDGLTSPARIDKVAKDPKGNSLTVVEISIHEGKNRQVRRMFAQVGLKLVRLQRIALGTIRLDEGMKPGQFRYLTEAEVAILRQQAGWDE